MVAWSFCREQETPAGSCAAAFEENHAWCPWQTECYRAEWGLGSAEWILGSLGSPGYAVGLEYHLCSVGLQWGDGSYSQPVSLNVFNGNWPVALRVCRDYPGWWWVMDFAAGWVSSALSTAHAYPPPEMQDYGSSCTRLVQQYRKDLIAACFAVSKLEDTVRFTQHEL